MPVTTYGSYSNLDNYIGCNSVSEKDAALQKGVLEATAAKNAADASSKPVVTEQYKQMSSVNYPSQFYSNLKPYNSTGCSSYKVPDYKPITTDALTHGGKQLKFGHFNIMDAYGANAASCDIGTIENFVYRK